jgi:hypothetical protein
MGFSKAIIAIKGNQSKKIKAINEILNLMDDEAIDIIKLAAKIGIAITA